KHKWLILDPTNVRKTQRRQTEEDPRLFGDDALPHPPGKEHYREKKSTIFKLIRTSNSQEACHEIMQQQLALNREAKMKETRNEIKEGVNSIKAQTKNEDTRTLAINIDKMNPVDNTIIEEAKKEIRANY
nr:hypothetical protein [Tanacetum cinerariifolium]